MAYDPVDIIEVRAWGEQVGAVAPGGPRDSYVFEYAEQWVDGGVELAPLRLPLTNDPQAFPGLNRDTWYGLPPLLADSLPDKFGNQLINAWMARQGVDPTEITPLDRLAYTGTRAMGALTFHDPLDRPDDPSAIAMADLVTAARAQLRGEVDDLDDEITLEALRQLIEVGSSAGGARAKAVVAYNPTTGQLRSGQMTAPDGFTQWLLKLDGVTDDGDLADSAGYGRIEQAYHLMALDAGLEMTECRLLEENGRAHFMTRRFDRTDDGARVHVLTLCAMAHMDFNQPNTHDYAQYLQVFHQLDLGPDALAQAFTRAAFNVAAVNRDDHTKNLAFQLREGGTWELTPAYDVCYAYRPSSKWVATHQMSVNGRFDNIARNDLLTMGDKFAVPSPGDLLDRVTEAVGRWMKFAGDAGVPDDTAAAIADAHGRLGLGA